MKLDTFVDGMLPVLFDVMNETGHAGHCILTSRVLNHVLAAVEVDSEPLCVDYEVANPAAAEHLKKGGDRERLRGDAWICSTGTGASGIYDHHVVTLVRSGAGAMIIDPSIIQVELKVPGVNMNMITVTLPFPLPDSQEIEVNGARLTYTFRPEITDYLENTQWSDDEDARRRAREVLRRMGFVEAAHKVP